MVCCDVVGCCNHSNKKNTTEKISYFCPPSAERLRGTWLSKIKRQDLPANYDSIHVCHVHFEDQFQRDIQVCGFFISPLKFCLRLFHSMVLIIVDYVLMYGKK